MANADFYQAMAMQRRRRLPRYTITSNLDETREDPAQQRQQQTQGNWLYNNPLSNLVKYVWSGFVWIFKLFFAADDVNQATSGEEFTRRLTQLVAEHNLGNRMRVDFFTRTFQELCLEARGSQRPILVVSLRDQTPESVRFAVDVLSNEAVQ